MKRRTIEIPVEVPSIPRLAYCVEEAGEALGLGRDLVFRLIKDGQLRAVKVGGRTIIPIKAIEDFLAAS